MTYRAPRTLTDGTVDLSAWEPMLDPQGEAMEHFIAGLYRIPEWSVRLGDLCFDLDGVGTCVDVDAAAGLAVFARANGSTFEMRRPM